MNRTKKYFTLVEILIAFVILTAGIVATTEMITRSQRQFIQLERRWANEHLLSLLTEYYLTFGHSAEIPEDLLPVGFTAECLVEKIEELEDFEEDHLQPYRGWALARYTISLFNEGEFIENMTIEQIIPETEL